MKQVLIVNGSPHKNGDTAALIDALKRQLPQCNIREIHTYYDNISPCVDCRFCWEKPSCAIKDGMTPAYQWIDEADWIILASPVYFNEVTGSLLQFASRLQVFWMAVQKRQEVLLHQKDRKGAAVLVGGGPRRAEDATRMMKRLLHAMGATDETIIHCMETDNIPAADNSQVMEEINALARRIAEE